MENGWAMENQQLRDALLVKELGSAAFQGFYNSLLARLGNLEQVFRYVEWLAENGRLGAEIRAAVGEKAVVQTARGEKAEISLKNARGRRKVAAASGEPSGADLLTTRQAAKLLAVGERTLWRWSRSGTVPKPVQIGRSVRFRRDELLAWMESGCPSGRPLTKNQRRC